MRAQLLRLLRLLIEAKRNCGGAPECPACTARAIGQKQRLEHRLGMREPDHVVFAKMKNEERARCAELAEDEAIRSEGMHEARLCAMRIAQSIRARGSK